MTMDVCTFSMDCKLDGQEIRLSSTSMLTYLLHLHRDTQRGGMSWLPLLLLTWWHSSNMSSCSKYTESTLRLASEVFCQLWSLLTDFLLRRQCCLHRDSKHTCIHPARYLSPLVLCAEGPQALKGGPREAPLLNKIRLIHCSARGSFLFFFC